MRAPRGGAEVKGKAKSKNKKAIGIRHREVPPPWMSRRNAREDESVLDIPGPVLEVPGPPSMALAPYRPAPFQRAAPPSRGRVATAASRVGAAVKKVAPAPAPEPFTKERIGKAAAYTGGLVGTTLAAGELGLTESKPIAVGATALGALGMLFLDAHWQQVSQGVLGAGVAQLTTALHSDRLRAKVDKEAKRKRELEQAIVAMAVQQAHTAAHQAVASAQVPAAPPPAATPQPQRNADGWDLRPAYAAVEQAHAEMGGDDARNAWEWAPPTDEYAA